MIDSELKREDRILSDIKKLLYPCSQPVTEYKICDDDRKDGFCCSVSDWKNFRTDEIWSGPDRHRWFRTKLTLPEEFDRRPVEFAVKTGREGLWDAVNPQMLFYLNGEIVQGVDINHRSIVLSESAARETLDLAFLAYSGTVPGGLLLQTKLRAKDREVESLYYDLSVPVGAARVLRSCDPESCRKILENTSRAIDLLDLREAYTEQFYRSLKAARDFLREAFYSRTDTQAPLVSAVGHTHIDIAWLWPVSQTREKALRSFSTVLRLMRRYPDYKFMSSQPVLYQFVKEQAPAMFEEIKQRVREHRWEIDGAMWLESDCNIPSGESLVRQLLKGHRFFQEEFGVESRCLWLPDSFGFNASLPQILRKSGIRYFMTTKIAWNESNQLPNDTFLWYGIDGSEVFAFMPTTCNFEAENGGAVSFSEKLRTTTYTGSVTPNMTLGTYARFQNKDLTSDTLMLYGYGDGGGGPTAEMLENAKRLRYGLPGLPRLELGRETEFFDRTYQKIAGRPDMPTWHGELYFEYHRGTYTSVAKNKRNNRKCEILYEQLETLSTLTRQWGFPYPGKQIRDGWDTILLNQFHDIIPGTCISEVYRTCDEEYARIRTAGETLAAQELQYLAGRIASPQPSVLVFNSLGYRRDDMARVSVPFPVCGVRDDEGDRYDVQYTGENEFIFFAKGIPPVGYRAFTLIRGEKPAQRQKEPFLHFENEWFGVRFNRDGTIASLVEKTTGKEFIRGGCSGNELQLFEDRPANWDNWNIDSSYRRKTYPFDQVSELRLLESGPVRFCLEAKRQFLHSEIIQKIYLYRDIPRIDFENTVDWRQNNVLLRVNFPVEVNTTKAAFEIQFGNLERETTDNTSWDSAKFEVCGHKWADLSENALGISLLNDCKYGYSAKGGNLGLTLIKSGSYPNADADIGIHRFTYAVYPHAGRWQDARTVQMAYDLNVPLRTAVCRTPGGTAAREFSMVRPSCENCFVEMIKEAEDGNGFILRVYENKNSRTDASIQLGFAPKKVTECGLMENDLAELKHEKNQFRFLLAPYEIKTFRIIF